MPGIRTGKVFGRAGDRQLVGGEAHGRRRRHGRLFEQGPEEAQRAKLDRNAAAVVVAAALGQPHHDGADQDVNLNCVLAASKIRPSNPGRGLLGHVVPTNPAAAVRGTKRPDGFSICPLMRIICPLMPRLGLHRMAVLRGADAQALFESRIEFADGQRGHRGLVQLHAVIIHKAIVESNACSSPSRSGLFLITLKGSDSERRPAPIR